MPKSWFLDTMIPPEFRFVPTDEELVQFYLLPKLKNFPLPAYPIPEVNLYGHSPDYFADRYNDHEQKIWYFFTPRERKYSKGNRPNRAAGDGYWKATGADKPIWSTNKIRVGSKKSLSFFQGSPPNGKKTLWLMKEYTVGAPQPANQSMRLDDWVLCVIYKRPEKSNTRASVEETDQPSNYIDLDVLANFDHQHQIGVDYETPTEVAEMNFDEIYDLFINQ
ncbi:NAC transcription factor 25 [Morella rubra]|uniref:NAC transcription factor 25 n=1 Tax=Morella rubra TaxID=262757 RepID=A0A6A1WK92_9ROSI|nr:NAC transcription factor 25 [Morella rubra]